MKLVILNYEYPPLGGGAGVCSQFHAKGLAEKGHEVKVITTWFEGEKEFEKKGSLEIIRLKSRRKKKFRSNPLEMLSWAIHTIRFINKNKLYTSTDLVLAHFTIPGGLVALHFRIYKKLPYLIISHGQDIPWFCPRELFFYHILFYLPIKLIISKAKKLTVLSETRYKDAVRIVGYGQTSKISIIPNGCDVSFFKPDYEQRTGSKLKLLFIGRLTRQKDPFTMLKAIQLFSGIQPEFDLTVIGDGPLRKKMEYYVADKNIANNIKFTGWVSKQELLEAYQSSHVLVMSSSDEGMSLGMLEALSCGMYVLTTPVSGHNNWIIEKVNGELFGFGDYNHLYELLRGYYEVKFKQDYKVPDNITEQVRNEMSWQNVVMKYNQLVGQ